MALWLAGVAGCSLPHGAEALPDTAVPGRSEAAILRIEVPQSVRRQGAAVPVQLEASVVGSDALTEAEGGVGAPSRQCIRLLLDARLGCWNYSRREEGGLGT